MWGTAASVAFVTEEDRAWLSAPSGCHGAEGPNPRRLTWEPVCASAADLRHKDRFGALDAELAPERWHQPTRDPKGSSHVAVRSAGSASMIPRPSLVSPRPTDAQSRSSSPPCEPGPTPRSTSCVGLRPSPPTCRTLMAIEPHGHRSPQEACAIAMTSPHATQGTTHLFNDLDGVVLDGVWPVDHEGTWHPPHREGGLRVGTRVPDESHPAPHVPIEPTQ
jgi:hypothetical protein